MLGSELWEDDFSSLLCIVKEFIVDVWESRKLRLLPISSHTQTKTFIQQLS